MKRSITALRFNALNAALTLLLVGCAPAAQPTAPLPTQAPLAPTSIVQAPPVTQPPAATAAPAAVKRTARASFYEEDDQGKMHGGLVPISVSIEPGPPEAEFRLGYFETNVGQVGPVWRASSWVATLTGVLETGKDPSTWRISWETTGEVDGPSAGGLMTVAFVSGLLGDQLRPDVGFTGTINPDGTIGPVGGIQYKLDGAAREGIKTFLIPIGQREEEDESGRRKIDLLARGQSLGVTVREVSTFDQAYEILTGRALPRVEVPNRPPDLTPDAADRLKTKVQDWSALYTEGLGRFKQSEARVQRSLRDDLAGVEDSYKQAQKALNEGAVAVSYQLMQDAAMGAQALALAAQATDTLHKTGKFDTAADVIRQSAGPKAVLAAADRVKAYQVTTPEDAIQAISAWSSVFEGLALEEGIKSGLDRGRKAKNEDAQVDYLYDAAWDVAWQQYSARAAEDALTFNFRRAPTNSPRVDPQVVERWAGVFRRAAEANVHYFNTLVLDDVAEELQARPEDVQLAFAANSWDYQIAVSGVSQAAMETLEKQVGKTPALSFAQLGLSLTSYIASSNLLVQHYSLDAELDEDGEVVEFGDEKVLTAMLDAASDRARERIAAVEKAGLDPSIPIIYFQAARAVRAGEEPSDKVNALRNYWTASIYARLMTMLAQPR